MPSTSTNQPNLSQIEPFDLRSFTTNLPPIEDSGVMARSNPRSPKLAKPTLRESIDADFRRYRYEEEEHGHGEELGNGEELGISDAQMKLNYVFGGSIKRLDKKMDRMDEGIQAILRRLEMSHPASPNPAPLPPSPQPARRLPPASERLSQSATPPPRDDLTRLHLEEACLREARLAHLKEARPAHAARPAAPPAAAEPRWKVEEIGFFDPFLDASYGLET